MCGHYSKTKSEVMKYYKKKLIFFSIPNHRSQGSKPLLEKAKPTSVDTSLDKPKALIKKRWIPALSV
jgi:hypothetical protein